MRKVISNTTPILSLLKIDRLNILKELYGTIIIPNAVYEEVEAGKGWLYYANLKEYSWIQIEKVKSNLSDLLFDLDKGEAEVILLAKEMSADLVIMDEELGRKYAKLAGLTMTGTLGLLLKAKEQKLIENIKPLLFELRQKGVWISPQIINKITSITNE